MARTRRIARPTLTPSLSSIVPHPRAVAELHAQASDFDSRISLDEVKWTVGFLKYFGYLNGKNVEQLTYEEFSKGVKDYQQFAGLKASGQLDQRTANAMQAPRCGICDVGALRMQLRLSDSDPLPVSSPKWHKPAIKWFIESYVGGIPKTVQEDIIATAYGNWTKVCGLKIDRTKDKNSADIVISTGQGPRNQFDGPGNTLAWAYLPPGDDRQLLLMYDLDESWAANITGSPREILMENVTCHEGGHTLGLEHSKIQTALMAPYYAANVNAPVSPDDIERIQRLYGPPAAAPATPTTPGPTTPTPTGGGITIQVTGQVAGISIPGYRVTKLAAVQAPERKKRRSKK